VTSSEISNCALSSTDRRGHVSSQLADPLRADALCFDRRACVRAKTTYETADVARRARPRTGDDRSTNLGRLP